MKLMSPVIKNQKGFTPIKSGFTLVELLVATAILGIISVIGVQLLWDTITTFSKQNSIEASSENLRTFIDNFTNDIQEAKSISVPNSNTIEITGNICRTIKYNPTQKWIEEAQDKSIPCTPPDSTALFIKVTQEEIVINRFEISPTGLLPETVFFQIEGFYKDSLGQHPIKFSSNVTPRVTL